MILPVVRRASELLIEQDRPRLPEGVSAQKLRHAFASILSALDNDPARGLGTNGY